MYKLKLATTEKDILEVEKMRQQTFGHGKEIKRTIDSPYYDAIVRGDMLAFQCLKEEELVGGMLIREAGHDIEITRLFVKKEEQGKGAGSFMMDYLAKHKEFFEDFYATDIYGIVLEPISTSIDFYFDRGYDYSGYQMYKSYNR